MLRLRLLHGGKIDDRHLLFLLVRHDAENLEDISAPRPVLILRNMLKSFKVAPLENLNNFGAYSNIVFKKPLLAQPQNNYVPQVLTQLPGLQLD